MEHLPYPGSTTGRSRITVPYVCQEEYDGGEFLTYPSRSKGGLPSLHTVGLFPGQLSYSHQMQLASLSRQDIESFYQTWLFFGLIHEILGSLYVAEDLIYTSEDQGGHVKAVSTSRLITALEEWVVRVQAGSVDPPVTYAHIAQCLCLTHAALSSQTIRSNFDPNVLLSIASLGQTFAYAANKAFNITNPVQDNRCPLTWRGLTDDGYWRERLLARGWCVSEVKLILDTTLSLQTLHFLACLDKSNGEHSHERCGMQQCTAYQNDLDKYRTQHVSKDCDCVELAIDPEALYAILKTGSLPLIRVRTSQTLEELSLDIIASRPTSRYVALSHVWADGLGNPYANAMPRCQLSDIARLIRELNTAARSLDAVEDAEEKEEELLLWCDTLCCPIQSREAHNLALEYMYQTYRQASHVLVLDASLRRCDAKILDIDETSMRILTSPWMRRLWTLQEGALPSVTNRLWFQLAHKALNLRELRINARDQFFSSIDRRGLAGDMLKRLGSFANIFPMNSSTHPRADLGTVIQALLYRSVSVSSDEPLLIGNLLGLDSAQILNGGDGSTASRVNRLWRMMPSAPRGIPSNLLFRVGPRLAEPGLMWAPATLLDGKDANLFIQSSESEIERGILTASDGLLVRFHGFRLSLAPRAKHLPSYQKSTSRLIDPNSLWMRDDAGLWYNMRRSLPVQQDTFLTDKTLAEVIEEGENMWVVHAGSRFPRQSESKVQTSIGLIVEVESEGEGKEEEEEAAVKKSLAKLHIRIGPVQKSTQAWFAAATTLSAKLASDSLALRKLAELERGVDERLFAPSPFKTTALEELESEIHHMAESKEAREAVEAAGNKFDVQHMENLIKMVLWGQYVCMREMTPRTQRWCVD